MEFEWGRMHLRYSLHDYYGGMLQCTTSTNLYNVPCTVGLTSSATGLNQQEPVALPPFSL